MSVSQVLIQSQPGMPHCQDSKNFGWKIDVTPSHEYHHLEAIVKSAIVLEAMVHT